jgi:hypothetical protein|tara:strand:- start:2055 stop:2462 length:408 start_codon:yes stop_codon:yes gene_type:complete
MPVIDLGMTCDDAVTESSKAFTPLPSGSYKMTCTDCELGTSGNGRPRLAFTFSIIESANPDYNGKTLKYFTPLPHNGNNSGIGFLTNVCVALGKPWNGSSLDTADYAGRTCQANVVEDPATDGSGKIFNKIKSFV